MFHFVCSFTTIRFYLSEQSIKVFNMIKPSEHIVSLKTYFFILLVLLMFTFLSIAITQIDLGPLAVAGALFFAILKTSLIVVYFMHLKFESKIYWMFGGVVLLTFIVVIVLTFLDYFFQ